MKSRRATKGPTLADVGSVDKLKAIVSEAQDELGADSCTFYIHDPWWPDDLRILFMFGVRVPEPMHGLLMPSDSRKTVAEGDRIKVRRLTKRDRTPLEESSSPTLAALVPIRPIFGNFVTREGVCGYARLLVQDGDESPQAAVFFNYRANTTPPIAHINRRLELLEKQIRPILRQVTKQLEHDDPMPMRRLIRILDTIAELTAIGTTQSAPSEVLSSFFVKLLRTILDAYRIGERDGFGTVHLFEPESERLRLTASLPRDLRIQPEHLVREGEGTISWVALKARTVLIDDLQASEFRKQGVYKAEVPGIRSELALPMIAAGRVVGVLNIESRRRSAFTPEDVRVLWYAANHAAVATHLGQRVQKFDRLAERTQSLFQACQETVTQSPASSHTADERLNKMANLLAQWTGADMCDIWGYDTNNDRFWGAGASSRKIDLSLPPRALGEGFSRFIIRSKSSVWINQVRTQEQFIAHRWIPEEARWSSDGEFPVAVSQSLASLGVEAEIGVPIPSHTRIIGVAWLKYKSSLFKEPPSELMKQIDGLVASVALVMEFVQKYDESVESSRRAFEGMLKEYQAKLFPTHDLTLPRLHAHVRSEPKGGIIGGDFFGFYEFRDGKRVAIILGDGEHHGEVGALNMLPLLTSFRILCPQTTSTHYVLEKMGEVAEDVGVFGTALYMIIDLPENEAGEWIVSASAAGDAPPLMIFFDLKKGNKREHPPEPSVSQTRLGVSLPPPLGEALTTCHRYDVIVAVTDGVLDAGIEAASASPFGSLGVVNAVFGVLQKNTAASPKVIADAIYSKAAEHGPIHDDATVMVIRMI